MRWRTEATRRIQEAADVIPRRNAIKIILTGVASIFGAGVAIEAGRKFKDLKAIAELGAPQVTKGVSGEGTIAAPAPTKEPTTAPTKKPELTNPPEELLQKEVRQFTQSLGLTEEDVDLATETKTDISGAEFGVTLDTKTGTPLLVTDQRGAWMPAHFKELGRHGGISVGDLAEDPQRILHNLVAPEFNKGTIPSGWRWTQPNPPPAPFDFGLIDRDVQVAQSLGIRDLRLTAALSGRGGLDMGTLPDWLRAKLRSGISKAELTEHMTKVVRVTMEHFTHDWYTPYPPEVVVVNEPLTPNDPFVGILGPEYVDQMYQVARETYPEARLMYNMPWAHFSKGWYTKTGLEVVARLKSKGLIDTVGHQMHLDSSVKDVPAADVTKTIASFEMPSAITEFSISIDDISGKEAYKLAKQAQVAETQLGAAFDAGVRDVTFWGDIDADTSRSCMWDVNKNRKPFYYAVRRAIRDAVVR